MKSLIDSSPAEPVKVGSVALAETMLAGPVFSGYEVNAANWSPSQRPGFRVESALKRKRSAVLSPVTTVALPTAYAAIGESPILPPVTTLPLAS